MAYFYIILFTFVVLAYFYDYREFTMLREFWLVVMWGVLVCVAGFRYHVGLDSRFYEYEYGSMPNLVEIWDYDFGKSRYQPLYLLFVAVARSLSSDFMWFQVLHAIFVNTIFFWFFRRYTRHTFVGLSLYFLMVYIPFNMEVLRESLAVGFFVLAWPSFLREKWWKYYLLCIIAFGFHISAVITFILPIMWMPFFRKFFRFGKRTVIICAILSVIGLLTYKYFFDILKGLSFMTAINDRVSVYSQSKMGEMALNFNGVIVNLARNAFYPLLALYFMKKEKKRGEMTAEEEAVFAKEEYITIWGVYMIVFSIFIFILTRYNNYFLPISIVVISDFAFSKIKRGAIRPKYYTWVLLFIPLFFFQIYIVAFSKLNKSTKYDIGMIYSYNSQFAPQDKRETEEAYRYLNSWLRLKKKR